MIRRIARRALSLFLLLLTVLSGITALILPVEPNNVSHPFPEWAQLGWSVGLLAGGIVGTVGIIVDGVWGLYVERAGLWILTGLCLCVVFAAISYLYHPYNWLGVGMVAFFGLCCGARSWAIGDEARDKAIVQLAREMRK